MTDPQPVKWVLNPDAHHTQQHFIEIRDTTPGATKYAITAQPSEVLNRDGHWEWEPQPSSRTDAFLARARFTSFDEALAVYRAAAAQEKVLRA